MTETLHLQISQLVDGELPESELALLLRHYRATPDMQDRLSRYQLIGELVRGGMVGCYEQDIAGRIMSVLAQENDEPVTKRPLLRAAAKGLAGFAVAASVAMVAVFGWYENTVQVATPGPAVIVPSASSTALASPLNQNDLRGVSWNRGETEVQNQLNNLLINHNQYMIGLPGQAMMPYLHIAAYTPQHQPARQASHHQQDRQKNQ